MASMLQQFEAVCAHTLDIRQCVIYVWSQCERTGPISISKMYQQRGSIWGTLLPSTPQSSSILNRNIPGIEE